MKHHSLVISFTDDGRGHFMDIEMSDHSEKPAEAPELVAFLRYLASEMEAGHAEKQDVELS